MKHFDGPDIDVLVESLPDRQEQSLQGHMIRNARESDGTQQDRITVGKDIHAVSRHHGAVIEIVSAPPVKLVGQERKPPVALLNLLQDPFAFIDNLNTDPVTR